MVKKYTCTRKRCNNWAVIGGVCVRHGAELKTCSHEGCNSIARGKEGVCKRHGAVVKRTMCTAEGCTKWRVKEGLCLMHHKAK